MRRALALLVLPFLAASAVAATRIDLNGEWALAAPAVGAKVMGLWPEKFERVDVPHTWNRAGANYDYLGTKVYFKRVDLPKLDADGIAQLHFGAVFYKASVYVNGASVGAHEGGYTEFSFDIAKQLRVGSNV